MGPCTHLVATQSGDALPFFSLNFPNCIPAFKYWLFYPRIQWLANRRRNFFEKIFMGQPSFEDEILPLLEAPAEKKRRSENTILVYDALHVGKRASPLVEVLLD